MYKNTSVVKIRKDRKCAKCGKPLRQGQSVVTTNKYKEGRRWYCDQCVANIKQWVQGYTRCNTYKNIIETRALLNNVPFDDEGAALAYEDALSEYEADCIECGKCNFCKQCI